MKNVRQQILEYLEIHRTATAPEIAHVFKMTDANARHHLGILGSEGAVDIIGVIQDGQRGRPSQRYSPTSRTRQHNLDNLAKALLSENMQTRTTKERSIWLGQIATIIWNASESPSKKESTASKNLTFRINQAIRRLKRLHYDVRWEAHAKAPRIIFENCPYKAIITEHPELCQIDTLLLQNALQVSVTQQVKLGCNSRGLSYCEFRISQSV